MKRWLALLSVAALFNACSEDPVAPGTEDTSRGPLLSVTPFTGAFVVGGFDAADPARGGYWAFAGGPAFQDARASLTANFSGASIAPISSFTDAGLAGFDIVVLSCCRSNVSLIEPLTAAMQTALGDFVEGGGCAILLPDNDFYGDAPGESLIDAFGMDVTGTMTGWLPASVTDPAASEVTDGPFGSVTEFLQLFPGYLDGLGPYAASLATNAMGTALAVIEPGDIAPGSGPVVVFSDVNTFEKNDPGFLDHETLWLNTINYCLTPASPDEMLESIKADIEDLAGAERLNKGESGSLTAKLSLAQKRISQGKDNAAINMLAAFINQVQALVNSGRLTPAEGQELIDAAQAVIDDLTNGG